MSLDAIFIGVGICALFLYVAIIYLGRKRAKRRDLRREARQMDELVERNKPKAYRCMGGAAGDIERPEGRTRVGL